MKTFIADIIPKIQAYSKKLDELVKLSNHHWVSLDELGSSKVVYIFRPDNRLIISENGVVQKASWEHIGNGAIVIETNQGSYLLKQGFLDDNILAFKLDSTDRYAIFVNESKYDKNLNTLEDLSKFLADKYINHPQFLDNSESNVKVESTEMDLPEKIIFGILVSFIIWAVTTLISNATIG